MNKITKLGVTALCGSLAAVSSANAGSLSAAGGIDMTWISMTGDNTGNPIGIGSNYTLSGDGELDNGWAVGIDILMTNANAVSNTNVDVTIPGLGALIISMGVSGSGIDRMDDMTPNVWEEAYASGLSTGIQTVYGGSGGSAGTAGAYIVSANSIASGSFKITVSNVSGGSLSEAIVINFVALKGASS